MESASHPISRERLARDFKRLVGRGAKPHTIEDRCKWFAHLVRRQYPQIEASDLGGFMCHELRRVFDSDSPEHKAVRYFWDIGRFFTDLPNAEQRRDSGLKCLGSPASVQVWRKFRELDFMRDRADELLVDYGLQLVRLDDQERAS